MVHRSTNLYLLVYTADQLPVFRKKTCIYWYALPISYQFFARKLVFIGIHRQSATSFSQENLYLLVCPADQLPVFQSKTCIYWYTPLISYQFSKAKLVFIGLQFHHHKNMSTNSTHTTHTTHTTIQHIQHIQHINKTNEKIIKRND